MKSPLFFYFRFKFYFFFHNIILYLYIPVLCHLVFSYSIFTLIFSPFFYILFHFPSLTFFKIIYFSRFNLISFYFYIFLYTPTIQSYVFFFIYSFFLIFHATSHFYLQKNVSAKLLLLLLMQKYKRIQNRL